MTATGPHLAIMLGCIAAYLVTALAAALGGRRSLWLVYPLMAVIAGTATVIDLAALLSVSGSTLTLPAGLPATGLNFRLDTLSGFFGLIVNLGLLAAAIYGLGLDRSHELSPRVEPFIPLFAAAMILSWWPTMPSPSCSHGN